MRLYIVLFSCLGFVAAATPGHAQEAPTVDWSGFYAGINGGYGSGNLATTNNSTTTDGTVFGVPGLYDPAQTFSGSNSSTGLSGGFGGFQAGYNGVYGRFVVGLEGDFELANITSRSQILGSDEGPTYDTTGRLDWFGTVRGRLGVTADRLLFYGTAGLAYGGGSGHLTITPGVPGNFTGDPFPASDSQTHVGYAVGAGVEAALSRHVALRLEYLYVDLGKRDYTFAPADSGGSITHSTVGISENLFRVGLNYRF